MRLLIDVAQADLCRREGEAYQRIFGAYGTFSHGLLMMVVSRSTRCAFSTSSEMVTLAASERHPVESWNGLAHGA